MKDCIRAVTVQPVVIEVGISLAPLWNGEPHPAFIDRLMVRIHELHQDLVRPRQQAVNDDGIAAGMGPVPGSVVDRDVDVSDAWRHGERRRSIDRHDLQVLDPVIEEHHAARQTVGLWRIDRDLRRRLGFVRRRCR